MVRLRVKNVIPTVVHLGSPIQVIIYVVGGGMFLETVTTNVGKTLGVKHTCRQTTYMVTDVDCMITVVIVGTDHGIGVVLEYEILTIMHHK